MPIVSHVHEQTVQANGSTHNVVRMYDGDAQEYTQSFFAPSGFDVATRIVTMIAELNEQLKIMEFNSIVGS